MCDEVLDSYLPILKSVSDWFVMNKIVERFDSSVFSNGDSFFMMQILILSHFLAMIWTLILQTLNSINLVNDSFDEEDPESIIHVRFMAWCNRFKQRKVCKKKMSE